MARPGGESRDFRGKVGAERKILTDAPFDRLPSLKVWGIGRFVELKDLRHFLGESPTMRLLRANHGPMILHFLHRQFKDRQRILIPHEQLLAELAEYQAGLAESGLPDVALNGEPADYLTQWCKGEVRYLQRFYQSGSDEPVYQLTSHTEAALRFVRESLESEGQFVGAHSRIMLIVETLRELAVFARDDSTRQIEALEAQKALIESRIERIRTGGAAERIDPTQVREKFLFAIELLQRVLGDFRHVEDKFKEITREVQDRQMAGDRRGGLLEFVLDAESVLKESDQGRSFYGFVNLILSPGRQEQLRQLVEDLHQVEALAECTEGLEMVRQMMPALTAEAEQVMQTNQRLSASIRRLLDGRIADERRKVALTIDEILTLARQNRNHPPEEDAVDLEVDDAIRVFSCFSRTFWEPAAEVETVTLEHDEVTAEDVEEAFDLFAGMQRLDWGAMRQAIDDLTARETSVSLPRLLADHPPRSGVVEVLGYIQIASDDDHTVIEEETDLVLVPDSGFLEIPRVLFRRSN